MNGLTSCFGLSCFGSALSRLVSSFLALLFPFSEGPLDVCPLGNGGHLWRFRESKKEDGNYLPFLLTPPMTFNS